MIKRTVLDKLQAHLSNPEMTVLVGPRQVGKTYLMKLMFDDLISKNKRAVFLSLDNDEHQPYFESQSQLINFLKLQFGNDFGYVFIDEIQKKENAGVFLKGIYDQKFPFKFILSGSGSLDLKAKIKESMAGRKRIFEITPISFSEFVNYKTEYKYENKLNDFFEIEKNKSINLLNEYLTFGGYPKVILASSLEEKKAEIIEIYKSYVEKDVTNLLKVEKTNSFSTLLKLIASQIGSLVNVSEFANTIGISPQTVENYLWYLEETFILKKVTPFYRNIRSELTKTPMYYFVDLGLRNYLIGMFGLTELPSQLVGHLFENYIFNNLVNLNIGDIHFWRTKDNAEVDFVIESGSKVIPIEVKYKKMESPKTTRSFKSFLTKYNPKKSYLIHLGDKLINKFSNSQIFFINFNELPQIAG